MKRRLLACALLALAVLPLSADPPIDLIPIGKYATGIPFLGAAEIAAFDPQTQRLFSINGADNTLDVIDLSDPTAPVLISAISMASCAPAGLPTSVTVRDGVVAVAAENAVDADPGWVAFFAPDGQCLNYVTVGAGPDMLTFTPNGRRLLVANEGEEGAGGDPAGSVAIIDMTGGVAGLTQADVTTVSFDSFAKSTLDSRIHRINPSAGVALSIDLEPEYIAVSDDSKTAWVTLQENNAIAVLDVEAKRFTKLAALGFKRHDLAGNAIDASDNGGINIASWPVHGMYQPDAIDTLNYHGQTFLFTANEGDARTAEETRVRSVTLDPTVFPNATFLQATANLGRLRITNLRGDTDGDGDFDELYSFGGRSFSIWTVLGELVFDSGDVFEQITAADFPSIFNSNGSPSTFDSRSDDKGPEPEGITLGKAFGRTYAFIGLERTGGIVIYDVSNPFAPVFVRYFNAQTFNGPVAQGDISPEGLLFVKAEESPTGKPLLIVAHEISGTVTIHEVAKAR